MTWCTSNKYRRHNLFRATGDGFRSWVSWFLLLRFPIVCFVLLGVIFCLDFGPFFFSSLVPLLGVIYLFILNKRHHIGYNYQLWNFWFFTLGRWLTDQPTKWWKKDGKHGGVLILTNIIFPRGMSTTSGCVVGLIYLFLQSYAIFSIQVANGMFSHNMSIFPLLVAILWFLIPVPLT